MHAQISTIKLQAVSRSAPLDKAAAANSAVRVGLIIAGLEVPHCHLHAVPINREVDLHFENADSNAQPDDLERAAEKIRAALADCVDRTLSPEGTG